MGVRTLHTRYRVDPRARIVWTSANWDRFARENGAPELAGAAVRGASLWDFVSGPQTRHLYEALFARVEETQGSLRLPFRCDSPNVRRFMELRIAYLSGGELELQARLLREEARPAVRLVDPAASRRGEALVVCSFCKSVRTPGAWVEVEEAVARLGVFDADTVPPLRYGVCPACVRAVDEGCLSRPRRPRP